MMMMMMMMMIIIILIIITIIILTPGVTISHFATKQFFQFLYLRSY